MQVWQNGDFVAVFESSNHAERRRANFLELAAHHRKHFRITLERVGVKIAVIAGKITANAFGTQGVATLLLIMGPPAIVYCWRESSTAMRMLGDTFSRGETAPIVVAQELQ